MENFSGNKVQEFSKRLCSLDRNIYLVCDGAVMPDLRDAFLQIDLNAIPLFFGKLDQNIIDAGPWMINVDERETKLAQALTLAEQNKVGVCWISDCYPSEMVRHLRSLNIARLPDGSICYFRHYDPDVLAWLAEKLDGEQAARLLGPASGIGFASGFAAGAIIDRPESLPPPKPGPIAFTHPQLLLLEERDKAKSRDKIKDFLRFSFPLESRQVSDDEILDFIAARERKAQAYGLQTERQIALWSYASVNASQDERMDRLIAEKIKRLTNG